jgi:uncharacterized protein CbrC (UPF0167 family)
MPAEFKYFLDPERFAYTLEDEVECDICHQVKKCFDGSKCYPKYTYAAFCFDCLAAGRLDEVGAYGVEADFGALKTQLQKSNPGLSPDKVAERAREITKRFEVTTPQFPTWQDWRWPAHCGDYCQLIRLAGQEDFNELAEDGNGKELFRRSLYKDLPEDAIEAVWSSLKSGSIKGIADPRDNWSPMAYVFRCLKCGKIVTTWDSA